MKRIVGLARAVLDRAGGNNMGIVAAGVAYYAFLSMIPVIAALVLGYGIFAEPATVERHIALISGSLPGEAGTLISEQMRAVTETDSNKKGVALAGAILLALFGARGGAGAILTAIEIAYDTQDRRGFIQRNLMAIGITLGALVACALVALAVAATGLLAGFVGKLASYLVVMAGGAGGALLLYRYGPDREAGVWRNQLPGAVLFGAMWVLLTIGFGIYAANFGNYGATYGSLSAIVVLLTWLYLSAYVLLLGAELNAELRGNTARSRA